MSNPLRNRLQKADLKSMVEAAEKAGFDVSPSGERVDVFDKVTRRYLGGFYWMSGRDDRPGGWRFDIALMEVFSVKDFNTALRELGRVQRLLPRVWAAWKAFQSSKSDKRWSAYRSLVAALFLRQDTE